MQVRARGGAVLLISEDLDELLELADRIVVMSEGRIVFETPAASAERHVLGAHMGGGDHAPPARRAAPAAASAHPTRRRRAMQIDANPFAYEFELDRTALVIIDMQRDFIEPGGFGETLGNDVALLAGHRARQRGACSRPGARRAAWWCTRARRTAPTCPTARRPSATAATRRCASATRARWAAS